VFDAAIRIRLATFTTDIVPHNIVINGESLYLLSVPRDRRSSVVVVDKMTGERAFEIPIPSARKVKKMLKMENDNIVVLVENEIFVMYNTPDTKPARAIAYEQS
jgi:hypothetical protein